MEEGQKRKAGPRSGHREVTCPVVTAGPGARGQGPGRVPATAPTYSPLFAATPLFPLCATLLALYVLRFNEKTIDDVVRLRTVALDLDFNISDPQPTETCDGGRLFPPWAVAFGIPEGRCFSL